MGLANGKVNVYTRKDDDSFELFQEIKAHEAPVWRVVYSHPKIGDFFATCSFDQSVDVLSKGQSLAVKQSWTLYRMVLPPRDRKLRERSLMGSKPSLSVWTGSLLV